MPPSLTLFSPAPSLRGMETPIRTVRHRSEFGSWENTFREPDPRLRGDVIRSYQGFVEQTTSFARRLEVPTTRIPLILNLGAPFRVTNPDGAVQERSSFLAGLSQRYALVESTGPAYCLQVDLTPLGAYRLLGRPMHTVTDQVVAIDDLFGTTASELIERLHAAATWDERFALIDRFLAARFATAPQPSPDTIWAWSEIVRTEGRLSIGALAAELGRSRKHLVARFATELGLPPKLLARILRFNHARRLLEGHARSGPTNWAEIALDCGYYDQAHLNRDFAEFAGQTPTSYLARRLPGTGGVIGD